jgi:hypothetical protein
VKARTIGVALVIAAAGCGRSSPITDEMRVRERFVHELAEREDLLGAWSLTSRSDLQFEDGLALIEFLDPDVPFTGWDEAAHRCETTPAKAVRWMGARSHLRIRGDRDGDRRLEIRGRADIKTLQTRPIVSASIDGRDVYSEVVDTDGYFVIAATVPAAWVTDWADVYITLSSVNEPWKEPEGRLTVKLMVARLEGVTWEPLRGAVSEGR